MSPRKVISDTHKISPILLLKHELKMNDNSEHAKVDGKKPMRHHQSYAKNYRELGKAGRGKGDLLQ